jgi:dTDP-4-dehydrorhamnose reductase
MKKILISGGDGELAKLILKHNTQFRIFTPAKKEMDITKLESVIKFIKKTKVNCMIHAAALTKPMSQHEAKIQESIKINIIGTSNVVIACSLLKIKIIYISTNFVYPGIRGNYKETDYLMPVNCYGWSKLGGECAVKLYKNSLILRICMTEDIYPHNIAYTNYITSFLKKSDAAKIILKLIDKKGIINIGGKKSSAYNFAKKYNKEIKKGIIPKNKRYLIGHNTSLNIKKLKSVYHF